MKSYITALFLFFLSIFAFAQDTTLLQYEREFLLGSIDNKISVLDDMVSKKMSDSSLYIKALEFATENKEVLGSNDALRTLTITSLKGLMQNKADLAYTQLLWNVFSSYKDDEIRSSVINVLSVGSYKTSETIQALNRYVLEQSALSEESREVLAVDSAVKTLGQFADVSSFSALFEALLTTENSDTQQFIQIAINSISTDYEQNVVSFLEKNHTAKEKLAVFRVSVKNTQISNEIHGKIAQKALSISININEGSRISDDVMALRQESLQEINKLTYTPAAVSVINYFILGQTEFKNGLLPAEQFIRIITTLGKMQTADATKVLSGYLSAINSQAELNGIFDKSVVLSVINALGELGDKSSFDTLLYVSYIQNYPEEISEAARDALARLKW